MVHHKLVSKSYQKFNSIFYSFFYALNVISNLTVDYRKRIKVTVVVMRVLWVCVGFFRDVWSRGLFRNDAMLRTLLCGNSKSRHDTEYSERWKSSVFGKYEKKILFLKYLYKTSPIRFSIFTYVNARDFSTSFVSKLKWKPIVFRLTSLLDFEHPVNKDTNSTWTYSSGCDCYENSSDGAESPNVNNLCTQDVRQACIYSHRRSQRVVQMQI